LGPDIGTRASVEEKNERERQNQRQLPNVNLVCDHHNGGEVKNCGGEVLNSVQVEFELRNDI
jgi:hypothetical protein